MTDTPAPTPKQVVQRFLDAGRGDDGDWDMDVIGECFDDSYYSHTWGGDLAQTGARQARFFAALEFVDLVSDDVIAEDDLVVHRSTIRLRHVGELFGVPPTNKIVTVEHVEMWRVTGGKIVEHWGGIGAGGQLYRAITT